jgi:hypothetical protein
MDENVGLLKWLQATKISSYGWIYLIYYTSEAYHVTISTGS